MQYGSYLFPAIGDGNRRAVITKYDSVGNLVWAKRSSQGEGFSQGIVVDICDNIYYLGGCGNASLYSLDGHTLGSTSDTVAIFIAKMNSLGSVEWLKTIGDVIGGAMGYKQIAVDAHGNIYVACTFLNNPSIGSFSFFNADPSCATSDILVAKFDSAGNIIWARNFGGARWDVPTSIAVTPEGEVYVGGTFSSDTLRIGSDLLVDTGAHNNYMSVFVAKFDTLGNPLWARSAGGTSTAIYTYGISINSAREVFMCGSYASTALSFGPHTLPMAPLYQYYGFLTKYSPLGDVSWAKCIQGRNGYEYDITTDLCDNVWISGYSAADTDTIDGHQVNFPHSNNLHLFFAEWNSMGAFVQATSLPLGLRVCGIRVDEWENLIVGGAYDFPAGADTVVVIDDTVVNTHRTTNMFVGRFRTGNICTNTPLACGVRLSTNAMSVQAFSFSPNPATTSIFISSPETVTVIAIVNLLGETLYSYRYNSKQVEVDISDLPVGMYFIRVNGMEIRKFIKQ